MICECVFPMVIWNSESLIFYEKDTAGGFMDELEGHYQVSIPVYEGPMDLLLHLVTKNRIEIHDIPIHEITDQYLDYLRQAQEFNLEQIGRAHV